MRFVILALLLATPATAAEVQPVTLSADEYQQIVQILAQRDPVVAALMKRQQEAQEAQAAAAAKPAPAPEAK